MGVYSTPEHPLGPVFEYMECRNINEYLKNNEDIERHPRQLDRWISYWCTARWVSCWMSHGVECMHSKNTTHENFEVLRPFHHLCLDNILTRGWTNVLVNVRSRAHNIAGLGVASL